MADGEPLLPGGEQVATKRIRRGPTVNPFRVLLCLLLDSSGLGDCRRPSFPLALRSDDDDRGDEAVTKMMELGFWGGRRAREEDSQEPPLPFFCLFSLLQWGH